MKVIRFMTGWAVQKFSILGGWKYLRDGDEVKIFGTKKEADDYILRVTRLEADAKEDLRVGF